MAGNGRASRLFYAVAHFIVTGITRLWTRTVVHGRENIPAAGAFVLAPVHRSNIDTPLVAIVTRRRLRFMGKDGLWRIRPIGWVLSAVGGFPVSRGRADREALARCIAVLESGEPLVLFPEGTRQSGPTLHPIFDGAAYVAAKAGVPIVPVGIGGSEEAMGKGDKFVRPRKCVLVVGAPIQVPVSDDGRVPRSAVRDVTARLAEDLQRLFDEARRLAG